jgi:hypothetical protein
MTTETYRLYSDELQRAEHQPLIPRSGLYSYNLHKIQDRIADLIGKCSVIQWTSRENQNNHEAGITQLQRFHEFFEPLIQQLDDDPASPTTTGENSIGTDVQDARVTLYDDGTSKNKELGVDIPVFHFYPSRTDPTKKVWDMLSILDYVCEISDKTSRDDMTRASHELKFIVSHHDWFLAMKNRLNRYISAEKSLEILHWYLPGSDFLAWFQEQNSIPLTLSDDDNDNDEGEDEGEGDDSSENTVQDPKNIAQKEEQDDEPSIRQMMKNCIN